MERYAQGVNLDRRRMGTFEGMLFRKKGVKTVIFGTPHTRWPGETRGGRRSWATQNRSWIAAKPCRASYMLLASIGVTATIRSLALQRPVAVGPPAVQTTAVKSRYFQSFNQVPDPLSFKGQIGEEFFDGLVA